jgi:RNA-directed DNA polymerase
MIHTKTGLKRLKDVNWDEISWKEIEKKILLLQQRIFKASRDGNKLNVKYLQSIIVKLPEAKLIAVKRVTTENTGRKTGGIDKQIITTNAEKLNLTIKLNIDGKASPIGRVWIPKPGKSSMRPLGIPTIRDRAKQMLVKMALEPEWEAKFESNSYGFRPGRNCHDAIIAIFNNVRSTTKPKWILDADLKGCYDNINHNYLLQCIKESPTYIIEQVKSWLQAGIFEGYLPYNENFENITVNSKGTPQGGVISPLLANIALHGLETHLKEWNSKLPEPDGSYKRPSEKYTSLGVIRYADDFVITHYDKKRIVEARNELETWLNKTSKLKLSQDKTKIKFIREGFDFLGFHIVSIYRNGKYRTKIYPQKSSVKRITQKTHKIIFSNKAARVEWLIIKLRPVMLGWANYFRYSECSETFSKVDYIIWKMLRKWVNRRSTAGGRIKAWNKYFPGTETTFHGRIYKDKYILKSSLEKNEKCFLPKVSWIESERWIKIKSDSSPYDRNKAYWANRKVSYAGLTILQAKLLVKQKFLCPTCGGEINPWSHIEVDHIKGISKGGSDALYNKQVLHKICHIEKTNKELR